MNDKAADEFQELVIKNTAATMYTAGADTVVAALATFILAMVCFPEVQAKAQAELDAVLGAETLPTFDDESSLPYLTAVVKECLRWEVTMPFAIPHTLTEDDEYRGYHFKKGSLVIPNSWAVLNDKAVYPEPSKFKPERFLKDGELDPTVQDPELAAFGYGRRICPGRQMARSTVWLTAGSILAVFNINKAVDEKGTPVEPSGAYISAILRHPEPFQCQIAPRSKATEEVVREL
ncbi:hypothetical protein HWV62_600 [Athelia sp. TMB]|nr:hypothetical protein HWV62_600 [Athelia sp. TMB]